MIDEPLPTLIKVIADPEPKLSNLLKAYADHFGAFGCIAWEAINDKQLCMLGAWFPKECGRFAMHDLPIKGTKSGEALLTGKHAVTEDVSIDGGPRNNHQFLVNNDVGPLCSIRFDFLDRDSDKNSPRRGTLDLLRTRKQGVFDEKRELPEFSKHAKCFPALYQTIIDRRSFQLVRATDEIINSDDQERELFERLCRTVGDYFSAIESSLFLMDPLESREEYPRRASTWKGSFDRESYSTLTDPDKNTNNTESGWVIRNGKSVLLFDLIRDIPTSSQVQEQYKDIA